MNNYLDMKQVIYLITILSALVSLMVGCQEDPALYTEADGVYFGTKDTIVNYSFAKYPQKKSDTILVPVNVLGNAGSSDRNFQVEIVKDDTLYSGIEGVHFKLAENVVIPAKAVVGTLPVIVYRTLEMEAGKVVNFAIKLKKNTNFPADGIARGQKLNINLAYIQMPATWGEFTGAITGNFAGYRDNFGTWTPTKYKLILDALYDKETGTTITEFPGSRFSPPIIYNQYVAVVRNYIKTNYPGNYGKPGPILTDPDNSNLPIQVGPANY